MPTPISSAEFGERIEAGTAAISLVGMSGVGKSFLSNALKAEAGFTKVSCDEEIMRRLRFESMDEMAEWLGQPFSPGFKQRQRVYLDLETQSLKRYAAFVSSGRMESNLVIDTTGSVVHVRPEIRDRLGSLTTVVAIEASEAHDKDMLKQYLDEPKPVVWGDLWTPGDDESNEDAIARCYPLLTAYRRPLYRSMAHVIVPMEVARGFSDTDEFLGHVREALPA